MTSLTSYFEMGGYGGYVWPAYALAAIIMISLLVTTWRTLKLREKQLKTLQELMPSRRSRFQGTSPQDATPQ